MESGWYEADIEQVIATEDQIRDKTAELASRIAADYRQAGLQHQLLLICILKGAVMFTADIARALGRCGVPVELEFIAASSYGEGSTSSGVVRLRADLATEVAGRHVLVVEDIVDSGLTLSWLVKYLTSQDAASVEVVTLFRKPAAVRSAPPLKYVGFEIPSEFVVGYGLDYAERYRELPYVGILKPEIYDPGGQ